MKKYDYNEISKIYDEVRYADVKVIEFLAEACELDENSVVLEIGCGTGNYLALLKHIYNSNIIGYDMSAGMILKAKEKCPEGIYYNGDAAELEFIKDSSIDLVYMVDVIHHIKEYNEMFKNIYRVLKNKGNLYVFTDDYEHIKNRLTTKYFPETLEAELNRYQCTEELTDSLLKNGFEDIFASKLEIGTEKNYGNKLIEIASKKGYSMFGLISDEAIANGINRIKEDMKKGLIEYNMSAPYLHAVKNEI